MVERTLHDGGELMLSSQERVRKTSNMRTIFECDTLAHASPSLVSHGSVLCMSEDDVGWSGHVRSWLTKVPEQHKSALLGRMLDNGKDDLIPSALQMLTTECSFIATVNQNSLVHAVTSLLTATQGFRGGGSSSLAQTGTTLNVQAVAPLDIFQSASALRTLCFALAWGLGAMLKNESRPKFSAWLRTVGESFKADTRSAWAGLPTTGLVWDYFPQEVDGGGFCEWRSWADAVPEWRYMWSGTEDFDTVVVPTARVASVQHCMRMLHRQGRPLLIMGAPGTGKTAMVRDFMAG
eukprot:CAMPEP_0114158092 /NCGR_PEP_ID=MMETSP0043_2-20121206/26998_1 /TAXON_ID=464988 /ORGANISM="Hemiselmis andersenii, Strain CCMP644" /LENGTH=292 /DNA_ID=CAMNT_0001253759 /DNA_START=1 /DNA_END=876 /DNA_ORIENTATION=-